MRLNHLDLHVSDVIATRDFFTTFFDFTLIETRGTNGLAILSDDAGLELVISRPVAKFGSADAESVGAHTYHIGFKLADRADVDQQYMRLKVGGVDMPDEPRELRGGWMFYCIAPGRVLVEVSCRS